MPDLRISKGQTFRGAFDSRRKRLDSGGGGSLHAGRPSFLLLLLNQLRVSQMRRRRSGVGKIVVVHRGRRRRGIVGQRFGSVARQEAIRGVRVVAVSGGRTVEIEIRLRLRLRLRRGGGGNGGGGGERRLEGVGEQLVTM